jgi:hypothetical protein
MFLIYFPVVRAAGKKRTSLSGSQFPVVNSSSRLLIAASFIQAACIDSRKI